MPEPTVFSRERLARRDGRLLGILRATGDELVMSPQPSVGELEPLLVQARATGLNVGLHVEGDPRPLAPGVGLAAYRIVQEALTNTRKHGGASRTGNASPAQLPAARLNPVHSETFRPCAVASSKSAKRRTSGYRPGRTSGVVPGSFGRMRRPGSARIGHQGMWRSMMRSSAQAPVLVGSVSRL